jgi:crotonobetainyl-CoA:carnitine CoA-transferase CaiB-like acyl-CoA transferase
MPGPLEGVKVVELGVWVAGPAAGGILADWGADVVKIEPPTGDPARGFTKMLGGDMETNPPFQMDNRSKRSIVLDLRNAEDLELAYQLVEEADIFVTNVRQGGLRRIGLDHETLLARNPRLVYGLITGYGMSGPDADQAAYDVAAYWARSGIAHAMTRPGQAPPNQRGGMGDHATGMTLAAAISAALFARERTGRGQLVSTSLYRQGTYTLSYDLNTYLLWGLSISVGHREDMRNPCINNYVAADGRRFWLVGLEGERHWPPLCRAVAREEWLSDPHYAEPGPRGDNARELIGELDRIFSTKTMEEWAVSFAGEPDLFWSPVHTLEDVVADEQFHAGGGLVYVPDGEGSLPMPATPADFHGTPWAPRRTAPALDEHGDEIRDELRRTR